MNRFCNIYYGIKTKEEPQEPYAEQLLTYGFLESFGFAYQKERIHRGAFGKPYLPGEEVHFNLSHGQRIVALACASVPAGIDVESPRRIGENTFRRCCTDREMEWLAGLEDREDGFLRLWTLKESYVKMRGEGLRIPPDSVGFSFGEDGEILCDREGFFWQYEMDEGILALCLAEPDAGWESKIRIQKIIF